MRTPPLIQNVLSCWLFASTLATRVYAANEGACAIEEHTILFANPGTTHLQVVQDVQSAAACCQLCQQTPGCNIFDWCNSKAADCSKNPATGKSYSLVPSTSEFRPGACYLGNDPLPRQLSEKEEHVPWDSGSIKAAAGSPRPGVCATKAHTIYFSNAGTKEIGVTHDVKSAADCCQLCQESPACNIYDWCNIQAESCASNPVTGKEYNLGSTPYRPGSCWLGFDTSPRKVSEDEEHTPWDSGTLEAISSGTAGAGCECPSASPGQRLVVADGGAPTFSEPCSTSTPADTLAKCTVFEISGTRVASSCGEEQCFLQINPGGFYVADYKCGEGASEESSAPSNFGLPGDAACPGSECGCPATNPGQRLVVAEAGAPYFPTPCAAAKIDPGVPGSGTPSGVLPQCAVFQVTGKRSGSHCGDEQCYLEISLEGEAYYVADYACGTTASNFGLPGDSRCPVCDAASCPSTSAGKRLVVAEEGAPYYSTPCSTGAAEGTLAKCTVFDISGTRTASSCADGHCYLAASIAGGVRYVVDYKCEGKEAEGSLPPSNFGLPGDPKCTATQVPPGSSLSGGAAFVAPRLLEADSVDAAIDIAKADPYKTVYMIVDSSSETAADIKSMMEKYDPPTISGESTGYLCGNIPNSREIRTGHTVFKAYLDAVTVLNNLISAFGSPSTPSETASFPNGVRDPKCNPQEWCCKGANGFDQAVHWTCLGPSSIVAAGYKKDTATLAESKTIVGPCAPLLILLPRADRRGGANADAPSLLAYCGTTKQYIAGWGAFSVDCGICGRETTISTSDSVLSTVTTGLINFVGDELMIMGCVGTVMDGTAISTSTVACGRVLADHKMVCPD